LFALAITFCCVELILGLLTAKVRPDVEQVLEGRAVMLDWIVHVTIRSYKLTRAVQCRGEESGEGKIAMQVEIVPMTNEEETKGKAYVHCTAWKEAYRGLLNQGFLDARTLEFSEERALHAFRAGISTLLAKDGNVVVGFADYGPYRGDDIQGAGEVYAIYLLSDYYGQGVGTRLMNAALQSMPNYDKVVVWVLRGNERAIRFYERFGFRFDGESQTLDLGGEVMDLRMVLDSGPRQFAQAVDDNFARLGQHRL